MLNRGSPCCEIYSVFQWLQLSLIFFASYTKCCMQRYIKCFSSCLFSVLQEGFPFGSLVRKFTVFYIQMYVGFSHFFIYFPKQNLQWARDVLLGSSVPWQQLKHMPAQGLFCERNKTNLFNVSHSSTCLHVLFIYMSCYNIHFDDYCHYWMYWHGAIETPKIFINTVT